MATKITDDVRSEIAARRIKRLFYSERSLADLDGILSYVARDNRAAAVSFVEVVISTCENL